MASTTHSRQEGTETGTDNDRDAGLSACAETLATTADYSHSFTDADGCAALCLYLAHESLDHYAVIATPHTLPAGVSIRSVAVVTDYQLPDALDEQSSALRVVIRDEEEGERKGEDR